MINNFADMIAGSLNLKEPWYVMGAEFCAERQEVHICIGVREEAVFSCPHCGDLTVRYEYEPHERIWRHGDFLLLSTVNVPVYSAGTAV